jgi:hypothetical protein
LGHGRQRSIGARPPTAIYWGTAANDTIYWGTAANDTIYWGTAANDRSIGAGRQRDLD